VTKRIRALFTKTLAAKERLDINEAIGEVVALTASEMQRNQVVLQMELATDLPPIVGDRVQLQQVMLNLILNGIEAMGTVEGHPRELVIRTRCSEGEVCVAVKDSGVGLEPSSLERIFDAFHSTKPDGLGMGLSISRSIIEGHGGRLWAVSNDGPGATLQFTLMSGG
jgi:signal transduction histidine kinase